MQGLSNTISRNPHANGWQMFGGWFKGAVVGAIGGAIGGAGAGIVSVWSNVAYGAAAGAFTGGLNAAVYGGDIGKDMLTGGAVGGFMGFVRGMQIREAKNTVHASYADESVDASNVKVSKDLNYNTATAHKVADDTYGSLDYVTDIRTTEPLHPKAIEQGFYKKGDLIYSKNGKLVNGLCVPLNEGNSSVHIGKSAFTSLRQLKITIGHEYIHATQNLKVEFGVLTQKQLNQVKKWKLVGGGKLYQQSMSEIAAHNWEASMGVSNGYGYFNNKLGDLSWDVPTYYDWLKNANL